jgi:hypothetical protein
MPVMAKMLSGYCALPPTSYRQDELIVSSPTTPATYSLTFVTEQNVAR